MQKFQIILVSRYFVIIKLSVPLIVINLFSLNVAKADELNFFALTRKTVSSLKESSQEVAQTQLPAYVCQMGVDQRNPNPPIAAYRASITCSPGTPVRVVLYLYHSNVNFPNEFYFLSSRTFNCTSNPCVTTTYVSSIDRTKLLYVSASATIRGYNGITYADARRAFVIRPYNNRGVMYPQIQPTRRDMPRVPFPEPPFAPSIPRDPNFSARLRQLYQSSSWTIPPTPEAHHIKPIFWGGSNNAQLNGVFLGRTTHRLFTSWWAQFSNRSW